MKLCHELSQEVIQLFVPFEFDKPSKTGTNIIPTNPISINNEFNDFLKRVGCYVGQLDIFYTSPGVVYDIHIDRSDEDNRFAKINYIIGGKDSFMNWFKLKEGRSCYWYTDLVGTKVRAVKKEDCDEIYRHSLLSNKLYLLDVGTLHSLTNPTEQRTCYSMFLFDVETKRRLSFDEATERLNKFLFFS